MLDTKLSNEDRKVYVNECADGRVRALIVYKDGKRANVSYPPNASGREIGQAISTK